jgi:hypothetical protein
MLDTIFDTEVENELFEERHIYVDVNKSIAKDLVLE